MRHFFRFDFLDYFNLDYIVWIRQNIDEIREIAKLIDKLDEAETYEAMGGLGGDILKQVGRILDSSPFMPKLAAYGSESPVYTAEAFEEVVNSAANEFKISPIALQIIIAAVQYWLSRRNRNA